MSKKTAHNYNVNKHRYKTCAGLQCLNKPITKLKIKYINKIGDFCQRCTDDLLRSELAVEIQEQI